MSATLKNGVAVLHDTRRYALATHLKEHGRTAIGDAVKVLGVGGYSGASRHIDMLSRANFIAVEQEQHPQINRIIKFLRLTECGRAALEKQRRAFKELAAA
jgi:predicted ArsR family transcriptional regulator